MTLSSIVSGIVKKEPKADRKKISYFFKDYDMFKPKEYSLGLLLRLLNPETITILSVQPEVIDGEPDRKVDRIKAMVEVLLPKTKVTSVHGELTDRHNVNSLVLDEDSPIAKEQLMITDLGLYFDLQGRIFVYKGDYVPSNASFFIDATDINSLELLRDADLEKLLPTEGMYFVSDLTRNREAEIAIVYFGDTDKRIIVSRVSELTSAILHNSLKACIHTAYFEEDFKDDETEGESVRLFDKQYDYVLVIRNKRIDVHLEWENGNVPKEPSGWVFLN